MTPLRIGLIAPPWIPVPPPAYGGTEAVLDALARGLVAAGHDVRLFTTGDATCPVPRRWFWKVAATPMGSVPAEAAHVLAAYDELSDCDVVHDHTLVGPLLSDTHSHPVVVTTNHGPFDTVLHRVYTAVTARVPLIAISRAQSAAAGDIPIAAVIHHGLVPGDFPMGAGDGGYLLFLGRMAPEKGAHRAIAAARATGVPVKIAAKMREPAEHAYFERYVKPQLGPGVEYVGEVSATERLELLGRAHALLNPIEWSEPFGMVMIEALSCGTPVLAYPNGAAPEIVEHGRTGFLCADEAEMSAAIGRLDEIDRAACRKAAETDFSAARMVDEHVTLYRRLLDAS